MNARFRIVAVALSALASLVVAACGTARRSPPIGAAVAASSAGRQAFMMHCHACHPGGEAGLAPALNNKPLPRSLIAFQVRHGLGAMPAFDEEVIDDRKLEQIADYLVALRRAPVKPAAVEAPGD